MQDEVAEAERRIAGFFGGTQGLAQLSELYHANGFLAEARGCYAALAELQPREGRWTYRHAMISAGYGELELANELLNATVRRVPDYRPGHVRRGDILLKMGDLEGAAAAFGLVQAQSAGEPYSLLGLARCDIEKGDWTAARHKLEAVMTATHNALGYDLIVPVYEHLGLSERAEHARGRSKASGAFRDMADRWMDELNDRCFDPFHLSVSAGAAQARGDTSMARRWLERAISLAPQSEAFRFQLAMLLTQMGELKEARVELERCTRLAPKFADGWAHLYGVLNSLGEEQAAQRAFAEGLINCPDSPGLHRMRAKQLVAVGRLDEAVPHFRTSIRLRPTEAGAYIELAMTLMKLGQMDAGMAEFHQALVAEPDHPLVLTALAFQAIRTRDEHEATRWLRRARQQPRVPRDEFDALVTAFLQTFGREPDLHLPSAVKD